MIFCSKLKAVTFLKMLWCFLIQFNILKIKITFFCLNYCFHKFLQWWSKIMIFLTMLTVCQNLNYSNNFFKQRVEMQIFSKFTNLQFLKTVLPNMQSLWILSNSSICSQCVWFKMLLFLTKKNLSEIFIFFSNQD